MKVDIYSTAVCKYCRMAKELLDSRGIEYVEHNVYDDADAMTVMREGGFRTVPQIFIDNVHIGGYDDLKDMADHGALDAS